MSLLEKVYTTALAKASQIPVFDPAVFNDELASRVPWCPVDENESSSSICFQTLKKTSVNRLEYKASIMPLLFSAVMATASLSFVVFSLQQSEMKIKYLAFGVLFIAVLASLFIVKKCFKVKVFDIKNKRYWEGKNGEINPASCIQSCSLEEAYAVQILRIRCNTTSSNRRRSYNYQLNLVLESGERIKITEHGKRKIIEREAKTISTLLNIPVWNAADLMYGKRTV